MGPTNFGKLSSMITSLTHCSKAVDDNDERPLSWRKDKRVSCSRRCEASVLVSLDVLVLWPEDKSGDEQGKEL